MNASNFKVCLKIEKFKFEKIIITKSMIFKFYNLTTSRVTI